MKRCISASDRPGSGWSGRGGGSLSVYIGSLFQEGSLETFWMRRDAVSGRQSVHSALKVPHEPSQSIVLLVAPNY